MRSTGSICLALAMLVVGACAASDPPARPAAPTGPLTRGEPDTSGWTAILKKHYDEQRGMNYGALKANDLATLQQLRQMLGKVDVSSLSRDEQLAYWINLYNVNVVAVVAEKYPIDSIRDLSTDPIKRLNVFDAKVVPFGQGLISLNDVENERIRKGFKDARIHFAINCAAASCPPIRGEGAYSGANLNQQLDAQTRKFLNGPNGVRVTQKNGTTTVRTTKIMDWFGDDFDSWGGGRVAFLRKHLTGKNLEALGAAGSKVQVEYADYDWKLNDRK